MVSGSPVAGGICTQSRDFLPPVAPLFPVYPETRFATVPGGACIRGAGAFLFSCQRSPGCPLRCGLSGNPAPVSPGGGFRFLPGEWNRGGNRGTPPARRMEPGAGCRGLPPGNSSIHRGQPRFFGVIVTLPLTTPLYVPPSSPFWRVLFRSRNESAFFYKNVTKTTFKTPESPKIHDF